MVVCIVSFSAAPQTTCVPCSLARSARFSRGYLAYKLDTVKTVLFCTDWSLREILYFYKRASFNRKVMLKILPLPSLILLDAFSRHYKHLSYFIQRYKTLEFLFSLESHSYYMAFGCVCLCLFVWMDEHITQCAGGDQRITLWESGLSFCGFWESDSVFHVLGVFTLWVSYVATPTLNYRWI